MSDIKKCWNKVRFVIVNSRLPVLRDISAESGYSLVTLYKIQGRPDYSPNLDTMAAIESAVTKLGLLK